MSGEITIRPQSGEYIFTLKEYEEGSSTSFGVRSKESGYEQALAWFGIDVWHA